MNALIQEIKKPYGPLLPWVAVVLTLLAILWFLQSFGAGAKRLTLSKLESDWMQARKTYQRHLDALRARKDLAQVWAALPEERDFAPLALGITDEAKRSRVILPALSYKTESSPVPHISRGLLQGTMTGKYEDLRRFIYDIETAEEMVYIEDLDLVRAPERPDHMLTFNIKIATYLRNSAATGVPPRKEGV